MDLAYFNLSVCYAKSGYLGRAFECLGYIKCEDLELFKIFNVGLLRIVAN
jgi:hypothetical protein